MKLNQQERVEKKLLKTKRVSRNYYLDLPYDKITRLSSIILRLREQGMKIATEITDRDTVYRLIEDNG